MSETIFKELWKPSRPLATNDIKSGVSRESREKAYGMRWVETAPSSMKNLIVVDLDIENAQSVVKDLVYTDAVVPEFSFLTTNPISTHAQVGWFIDGFTSTPKAQYFFEYVRTQLTVACGGDLSYGARTMRNPLSTLQSTQWGTLAPQTLTALSEATAPVRRAYTVAEDVENLEAFGRNDLTFKALSKYAYRTYVSLGFTDQAYLKTLLTMRASELNLSHVTPLPAGEVAQVVNSVFKWVTRNFTAETFSSIQKARSNKRWGGQGEQKAREIMLMREAGMSTREIGAALGLEYNAAKAAVQRAKKYFQKG